MPEFRYATRLNQSCIPNHFCASAPPPRPLHASPAALLALLQLAAPVAVVILWWLWRDLPLVRLAGGGAAHLPAAAGERPPGNRALLDPGRVGLAAAAVRRVLQEDALRPVLLGRNNGQGYFRYPEIRFLEALPAELPLIDPNSMGEMLRGSPDAVEMLRQASIHGDAIGSSFYHKLNISEEAGSISCKIVDALGAMLDGTTDDINNREESAVHPVNVVLVQVLEFFHHNRDMVQSLTAAGNPCSDMFNSWESRIEKNTVRVPQYEKGERYIIFLNNAYDVWQMRPGAFFSDVELMTWKVLPTLKYELRAEIKNVVVTPYKAFLSALQANPSRLSEAAYSIKRLMRGKKNQDVHTAVQLEYNIGQIFES